MRSKRCLRSLLLMTLHASFPNEKKVSNYDNPDPAPELQNVSPSADTTVPSQQELDLLFGPLYNEFFNDGTSRVNKSSFPTNNSTQQDTPPTMNIHPTSEPSTPTNIHAEENNDNQVEFTNPFCTPVQENAESSSPNIGTLNVHTFNQPQDSEYRWTKDHPLTQVRRNPSKPVQTRRQLATDPEMCMFALTVSIVEPKNIKEAMADSWIEQCRKNFIRKWVDFEESCALVARMEAVRIFVRDSHKDGDGDALFQLKSDSLPHAHAQTTKTYYKHRDSRIMKAQELKTKTSAQTLIYKIFLQRYQVYQGRLLASFQDDAKHADELTERSLNVEADVKPFQDFSSRIFMRRLMLCAVDSCETAQEIWLRVQQMMKGSDIRIQEKKDKLFNKWERFTSTDGESIESYYHRFSNLMNDFKRNKHFPKKIASNLKFLNNLQPEWSRHEVDDLRAKRLAKTHDSLALMANSNNPFNYPVFHQDQPSPSTYMQQPMPNPEDITDPTTTMNMALVLMAKAFKLNYSTPTNNNQRISSNLCNRQIAQPGMNMGQDRQMQMVGGNGGNQFRQYAGQNVGYQNEYNAVQNVGNQVVQDAVQNQGVQNIGNQNGQIGVQNIGNGNVVAARAEGNAPGNNGNQIRCYNCRGLGHLARNCTVRPRRRDAAYLQTQLLIAQKEEAGIQLQDKEFDLMAAAADLDEIEEVN
ncbi:retrovirus-related pol polyprotein from transposon TNT 1-94 [Tanacetum coccineum]